MTNKFYTTPPQKIGPSFINSVGRMRYSALIDIMQDCSGFQLLSMEHLQGYFREHNIGMYLVSRQLDIKRMPRYTEQVTVATGIYEVKSVYGFRNTLILGEDGGSCVDSYACGAFVNLTTGRPVKMPQEVLDTIPRVEKVQMEYTSRKISIPDVSPIQCREQVIPKSYIDVNRHVNNARYLDLAVENLSDDFLAKRVRIEYRDACTLKDVVRPLLYKQEGSHVVVLTSREGDRTFAVVEFSG